MQKIYIYLSRKIDKYRKNVYIILKLYKNNKADKNVIPKLYLQQLEYYNYVDKRTFCSCTKHKTGPITVYKYIKLINFLIKITCMNYTIISAFIVISNNMFFIIHSIQTETVEQCRGASAQRYIHCKRVVRSILFEVLSDSYPRERLSFPSTREKQDKARHWV